MQVPSQEESSGRLHSLGAELPVSFEMYPPRSAKGRSALAETTRRLAGVATAGFSVTMGAGGSAPAGTQDTALRIAELSGRPVMAHLIAEGHSRAETLKLADGFWRGGITRILALRGDPPSGDQTAPTDGFSHASELVAALRDRHEFRISVAAYPEKHPQARTLEEDIDHLKEKLDAGASEAICQFVLDPSAYARFLDACGRRGVTAPLVPGLMPLENWPRVRAFAAANETRIPRRLDRLFGALDAQSDARRLAAMAVFAEQARQLVSYGAPALHIYALNRWEMPLALAQLLKSAA